VLWIARTGGPWGDLPRGFGNWITAYTRFRDWAKAGVWKRMFDEVSDEPGMEYVMMPPSSRFTVTDRVQKGTQNQAIGRSKGGITTGDDDLGAASIEIGDDGFTVEPSPRGAQNLSPSTKKCTNGDI
jgi:transposase